MPDATRKIPVYNLNVDSHIEFENIGFFWVKIYLIFPEVFNEKWKFLKIGNFPATMNRF